MTDNPPPPPRTPVLVKVSALDAGHITLPEPLFVTDADPHKRTTVPSLSFLIQHPSAPPSRRSEVTNLVFDLGVKRDLSGYRAAQQEHIKQRQPVITSPDCAESLRRGTQAETRGLSLLDPGTDVDFVVLSHVHWDHVGTPSDFERVTFIVGSGTLDLLRNGAGPLYPKELFNEDELPRDRTVEFRPVLPPRDSSGEGTGKDYYYYTAPDVPRPTPMPKNSKATLPASAAAAAEGEEEEEERWTWKPLAGFPATLDFFGDGSVYVVDSPGHLYGHVNLLARTGKSRYVYLGGDCCHDTRILSGEKGIAMYDDGRGGMRSVHTDTVVARRTLDGIRDFVESKKRGLRQAEEGEGEEEGDSGDVEVEVVVAHDKTWREENMHRFWPGHL